MSNEPINPYASPQTARMPTAPTAVQNDHVRLGRSFAFDAPPTFEDYMAGLSSLGVPYARRGVIYYAAILAGLFATLAIVMPNWWLSILFAVPTLLTLRWMLAVWRMRRSLRSSAQAGKSIFARFPRTIMPDGVASLDISKLPPSPMVYGWDGVYSITLGPRWVGYIMLHPESRVPAHLSVFTANQFPTPDQWQEFRRFVAARFFEGISKCGECRGSARSEELQPMPLPIRVLWPPALYQMLLRPARVKRYCTRCWNTRLVHIAILVTVFIAMTLPFAYAVLRRGLP